MTLGRARPSRADLQGGPRRLGRWRWVVERTFAWLHQFKRLLVRYERRAELHEALLGLACSLVCFRRLKAAS
jgi:transposase